MKSYETIRCHCLCDVCGGDTVGHENIINSHTFNNISAHCSLIRVVDITASVKFSGKVGPPLSLTSKA